MEYFSKFLRAGSAPQQPKLAHDHIQDFHKSWQLIKNTLRYPDERQLSRGIKFTDVPAHLKLMVDALVWESTRTEEGTTGQCLEYLLKNDVLGTLVRLSEDDRPFGIQAEVLRSVANMVVLLDEQFLVHSAVHKAVLRLLRGCVGEQIEEQVDGRAKPMGAASAARSAPSEYEEDLVDLLCVLCSRIRNYRELLMIFFHDKHWFQSHLQTVREVDEDDEDEKETTEPLRGPSPTPSQTTITSVPASSVHRKAEYEFLLFNYLLRFVHREGRIGDFARAGLLFLMDVAMSAGEPIPHRLVGEDSSHSINSEFDASVASDPIADAALALAEYVLDGDFSEVLGAGLGAVYSLLPTKLEVLPEIPSDGASQGGGIVLGAAVFGTEEEKRRIELEHERNRALGLESSTSPEFKARLEHFLKLLEFLQDVLRRNVPTETQLVPSALVGTAIVQSILDAVKTVFLENILYTSILECSDTDGSAVAVMAYIDIMIRTLTDSPLGDMLVDFLMSEDDHDKRQSRPDVLSLDHTPFNHKKERARERKVRRRKSSAMVLLEMEAPDSRKQSEYFTSLGRFTLKDLIFSNLRSPFQPPATAALQLLQSLLLYHPFVCIDKLLITTQDPNATNFPQPARLPEPVLPRPASPSSDIDFVYPVLEPEPVLQDVKPIFKQPEITFAIHEREMEMYLSLISRVDPANEESPFSTGYDHYLTDAIVAIQSLDSFQNGTLPERSGSGWSPHHRLDSNDPLLNLILKSLRSFFSHIPEYNIALTGVLSALASDPYRSMGGWLTFDPPKAQAFSHRLVPSPSDEDGDDQSVDLHVEDRLSSSTRPELLVMSLNESMWPILYSIFNGLVSQVDHYRAQVEHFDKFLFERRQGLLFSENLNDALNLALELVDEKLTPIRPTSSAPAPRAKTKNKGSSLVSFLSPKKKGTSGREGPAPSEQGAPSHIKAVPPSPFGAHYQQTGAIDIQPLVVPLPTSGPWSPVKKHAWYANVDDDVLAPSWGGEKQKQTEDPKDEVGPVVTKVTLSQLLDNVVILEESIKELTAIVQARRCLGIDAVRYQ